MIMKRLFVGLTMLIACILFSCSENPNNPSLKGDPGAATITVKVGKVGSLGKIRNIELSKLYITLTAPDENPIYDTFSLSGNSGTTINKTYSNLASLLKTWTLSAETRDIDGIVIHSGTQQFIVPARSNILVNLNLDAKYSMLKANFFPVRDSVTRCEMLVDGNKVNDSSFAKQALLGDNVKLSYNYFKTGVSQRVKLDVYGTMWGFDTLLYTCDTAITPQPGVNSNYNIALKWVGPALPPPGQATMMVVIGPVGTITITGNLTSDWPMFHMDAQHRGKSIFNGPQDPNLAWSYNIGSTINSSPVIDKNGTIYVGSDDHNLYAFNPDGSLKWTFTTNDQVYSSPAIAGDGTIYVGSLDHYVYAINPNGSLKWNYLTGGAIYSSPTVGNDGTIYIGSYDAKLYAINANGTLKGSFAADGRIFSSPAIGRDGTIYFGSCDINRFYAVKSDFTLLWKTEAHSNIIASSGSLSPGETAVYYGAQDGYFYARNASDGSLKWKIYAYGGFYGSAAIGPDGTVYIGSCYGNLWALNREDGSKKWDYYVTLTVNSSPAIGADGTIYYACTYGRICAMNPDGTEKFNIDISPYSVNIYSSPAIGGNGKLYIGTDKGWLLAFGNN